VKRYEFALQSVLRARRAQESVARADLLRANLNATAAETAEDRSRAHYEDVITADGVAFLVHRQRFELAAGSLIGARGSVAEARAAVATAMEGYIAAARSVSVLEHLDERHRQEHGEAVQRQEANQVDELVISRYGRDRRQTAAKARPQP
jgi:flagellar export protein FliJ